MKKHTAKIILRILGIICIIVGFLCVTFGSVTLSQLNTEYIDSDIVSIFMEMISGVGICYIIISLPFVLVKENGTGFCWWWLVIRASLMAVVILFVGAAMALVLPAFEIYCLYVLRK